MKNIYESIAHAHLGYLLNVMVEPTTIVQCPAAQQSVFLVFRHSQYGVAAHSANKKKSDGESLTIPVIRIMYFIYIYIYTCLMTTICLKNNVRTCLLQNIYIYIHCIHLYTVIEQSDIRSC